MRAAAIQLDVVPADVDANLTGTERLVDQAAVVGATAIALPEFFTTGMPRSHSPARSARRCCTPRTRARCDAGCLGCQSITAADSRAQR